MDLLDACGRARSGSLEKKKKKKKFEKEEKKKKN
jgi:hypothetical protein